MSEFIKRYYRRIGQAEYALKYIKCMNNGIVAISDYPSGSYPTYMARAEIEIVEVENERN